jgi:hypothetical protein
MRSRGEKTCGPAADEDWAEEAATGRDGVFMRA